MIIGTIGNGFLNGTLKTVLESFVDFKVYDKNPTLSTHTFEDVVKNSDIIFIGVPTPMRMSDKTCDFSIVETVISQIEKLRPMAPVVIRSTITPGTTKYLAKKYRVCLFHMPEFLTEKTAVDDFRNVKAIVLGHDDEMYEKSMSEYYKKQIEDIFSGAYNRKLMKCEGVFHTKTVNSELSKYFMNSYFMVKVALFNEYYQVSKGLGADFDDVKQIMFFDPRIGESHTVVPGWDGDFGAGGHCVLGNARLKIDGGQIKTIKNLYKQFAKGNKFLVESCNINFDKIEWKEVKNVVKNELKEKLIKFSFGDKHFICTENHLMPIKRNYWNYDKKISKFILVKARDITIDDELIINA